MIYDGIEQLVGNTPILNLKRFCRFKGLKAELYLKLERYNPTGSAFDRVALGAIERAQREGLLPPGATIVVPTTGNLGASIGAIAAAKGYRVVAVLPENTATEWVGSVRAHGVSVTLSPAEKGIKGAIEVAERLQSETENAMLFNPYLSSAAVEAHENAAAEIYRDFKGILDVVVIAVKTGGTLSGVGGYLKKRIAKLKVVAVEDASAPLLTAGRPSRYPALVTKKSFDAAMAIEGEAARAVQRELALAEGILIGDSSAAALCAAIELAGREENAGKRILVVCPDGGERYLQGGER